MSELGSRAAVEVRAPPSWVINWRRCVDRLASDPQRKQSSSRTEIGAGELLHEPSRLFVFVRLAHDRRFVGALLFLFVLFVFVFIRIQDLEAASCCP
jgi:hypothetical protein